MNRIEMLKQLVEGLKEQMISVEEHLKSIDHNDPLDKIKEQQLRKVLKSMQENLKNKERELREAGDAA